MFIDQHTRTHTHTCAAVGLFRGSYWSRCYINWSPSLPALQTRFMRLLLTMEGNLKCWLIAKVRPSAHTAGTCSGSGMQLILCKKQVTGCWKQLRWLFENYIHIELYTWRILDKYKILWWVSSQHNAMLFVTHCMHMYWDDKCSNNTAWGIFVEPLAY